MYAGFSSLQGFGGMGYGYSSGLSKLASRPVQTRFGKQQPALTTSETKRPALNILQNFRQKLLQAVDQETTLNKTAAQRKTYEKLGAMCPMWGQCVPVSMAVKETFGGQLIRYELEALVEGKKEKITHWANQFMDGEVDLTSDQFNGDGLHTVDDPKYGVIGKKDNRLSLPVFVIQILSKKVVNDFYYGRISNRTKLLANRLRQIAAE